MSLPALHARETYSSHSFSVPPNPLPPQQTNAMTKYLLDNPYKRGAQSQWVNMAKDVGIDKDACRRWHIRQTEKAREQENDQQGYMNGMGDIMDEEEGMGEEHGVDGMGDIMDEEEDMGEEHGVDGMGDIMDEEEGMREEHGVDGMSDIMDEEEDVGEEHSMDGMGDMDEEEDGVTEPAVYHQVITSPLLRPLLPLSLCPKAL